MNRTDYARISRKKYDEVVEKYEQLLEVNREANDDIRYYRSEIANLTDRISKLREKIEQEKAEYEKRIAELEETILDLSNQLAHEKAINGNDGSNSGIPTSQTPISKKKRVPNSREKTDRHIGGQEGHQKSAMTPPKKDEIDEVIIHKADDDTACSECGSHRISPTGKIRKVYEKEMVITVRWTEHDYPEYVCEDCGSTFYMPFDVNHRSECQYGADVQALILSLMNTGNVPINKVKMLFEGMTDNRISPSEGYIAKVQKRSSKALKKFKDDLKIELVQHPIIYWDDTVIFISRKRGCMRFYGDERIAYYTAHESKGSEGIDEDNVLALLTKKNISMHDHNVYNYNAKWRFRNIECNQHLQRDCQKNADNTTHMEFLELKKLIADTIHERKVLIDRGVTCFSDEKIAWFFNKVEDILRRAEETNSKDAGNYGADFEKALIRRVRKYQENYFAWVRDFSLPTTNNLSESSLRCVKSHMKISGQFQKVETARYYANLKTYIETCRRNGINEVYALRRLCAGNPVTVREIFHDSH